MILHPPENVKSMNFFTENMAFPVVIFATNEREERRLEYIKKVQHTTESLCKWCIVHSIEYQITYPLHWIDVLRNPKKYVEYLRLKRKLNKL